MFEPRKKQIPSGSFFVSTKSKMILKAVLGTCVGVAIYDENNQVGGMIHLLLASPPSLHTEFNSLRYASTGMSLFIEALVDAGACKANMKAAIAGGALIGPITELDLFLNIGGDTTDAVKSFLSRQNIVIEKSETGGFFACCLSLDLFCWKATIEPAGGEQLNTTISTWLPDKKTIDLAIENLVPIPQVAIKILKNIDDDEHDMLSIAGEVRKDQVLSARTLRLCNSAMLGRRIPVESVEEALIYLGKTLFVQFILSAAMKNYFKSSGLGYSICKGGLYHHAVGTAHVAENIAAFAGNVKPSLAYIAGLLHDIGKVVLDQFISITYPLLYRNPSVKEIDMMDIEKEVMGTDHTQIGLLLAKRWGLSDAIADTIAHHHQPEKSTSDAPLSHIVYLADLLMYRFNSGLEIERFKVDGLYRSLEKVGIAASHFTKIVDMIPTHVLAEPSADCF